MCRDKNLLTNQICWQFREIESVYLYLELLRLKLYVLPAIIVTGKNLKFHFLRQAIY